MKKSIIINIISWLGISLLLFFYLERQLVFHYFYIEQFRLFRFNQDYALQLFSHPEEFQNTSLLFLFNISSIRISDR